MIANRAADLLIDQRPLTKIMSLKVERLSDICNCKDCVDIAASRFVTKLCITGFLCLAVLFIGLKWAVSL